MNTLHIVQGGIKNADKAFLEKASKQKLDAPTWVVPKSAQPNDEVVVYVTGYGFFATAFIKSPPVASLDWHNKYESELTRIELIDPPISIEAIRNYIPELTWAKYPRGITTPDLKIANKVRKLIKNNPETAISAITKSTAAGRNKKLTTDDYVAAFRSLNISQHQIRMIQANYYAPKRAITATQMAKAMGYHNFNASNLHYGHLGRLVGEVLGWLPKTPLHVLVEFEKPGREWHWVMRSHVAKAVAKLGWTGDDQLVIPEEISEPRLFPEGAVRSVSVNAYERSASAREECILYYGCCCSACGILLADIYGDMAQGYIHVHHLRQLAEIGSKYRVDPIQDLRPLCPNCHAIIHMRTPPYTIKEISKMIKHNRILHEKKDKVMGEPINISKADLLKQMAANKKESDDWMAAFGDNLPDE